MAELDREKIGKFIAALRKENGLTQKELAEKLFLSDKAVSKWERGMSLPDIALLEPLAGILGVTTAELLHGEPIEKDALDKNEVERLISSTVRLSVEEQEQRSLEKNRWKVAWVLSLIGSIFTTYLLLHWGLGWEVILNAVLVVEVLCPIFGFWSCFFARDVLPYIYDQSKISFYSQGVFRMNIPGIYFNNSNWPHILRVMRLWMTVTPVIYPLFYGLLCTIIPHPSALIWDLIPCLTASLGFFVPIIVVGKKYE